jgi:hypothetical protein
MEYIIGFGIGVIFAIIGYPLLQSIGELLYMLFEKWKSAIAIHITENNSIVNEINSECNQNTEAIGFKVPPNESDLPDEDDDDCDNCNKSMGFRG